MKHILFQQEKNELSFKYRTNTNKWIESRAIGNTYEKKKTKQENHYLNRFIYYNSYSKDLFLGLQKDITTVNP